MKNNKRFSSGERLIWIVLMIIVLFLTANTATHVINNDDTSTQPESSTEPIVIGPGENVYHESYGDSTLEVYFFDVGQADSILLRQGESVMLVDTGNAGDADNSFNILNKINLSHELQRLGITKIDYLVATHPHEDHMGSMYKIINLFEVKNVYANNILPEEEQAAYYKRFVSALENTDTHFISHTNLSEKDILIRIEEYNKGVSENDRIVYNPDDYL